MSDEKPAACHAGKKECLYGLSVLNQARMCPHRRSTEADRGLSVTDMGGGCCVRGQGAGQQVERDRQEAAGPHGQPRQEPLVRRGKPSRPHTRHPPTHAPPSPSRAATRPPLAPRLVIPPSSSTSEDTRIACHQTASRPANSHARRPLLPSLGAAGTRSCAVMSAASTERSPKAPAPAPPPTRPQTPPDPCTRPTPPDRYGSTSPFSRCS